jgi:hypothetical protein
MVKRMKKYNDIDTLGLALSRGLIRQGTRDARGTEHPDAETMASVIEGIITGDERDALLKHISSCDSCYETFLLTAELEENAGMDLEMKMDTKVRMGMDVEMEIEKETRKLIPFKPLALAASILIVVFSIYVFYRSSDIPKTPAELIRNSETMKMPEIPKSMDRDISFGEKEEQPAMDEAGEGDTAVPSPAPVNTESTVKKKYSPLPSKKMERGEPILKKGKMEEAQVELRQQKMYNRVEAKKGNEMDTGTAAGVVSVDKVQDKESAPLTRAKASVEEPAAESHLKEQQVEQKQAYHPDGMPLIQSRAVMLNVQAQQFSSNMPKQDIGKLFKESLDISQQLVKEYDTVRMEAEKTGDYNRVDSYVTGLSPLITVTTVGSTTRIVPNMDWFFSMSDPRTVEYQFFSLARSGWCDLAGSCYDGFRDLRNNARALKRGDKSPEVDSEKVLLEQWQKLNPRLDGVFKQIADRTIMNLQKSQK